ncbi:MAG: hypothetical protein C0616_03260, partial [Desulfuromonas sp.]
MFNRIKFTTVLALLLAVTMTMLLAGCEGDSSKSSTAQNLDTVSGPTGTVQGLVTDVSGMPLEGIQVYGGGKTATTNAGGQYTLANVAVVKAVGADQTGTDVVNQLLITIAGNDDYLGAIVTVDPAAQFDGSNDDTGSNLGSGLVDAEGNNKVVTFVDGFNVQATPAALPALTETVTGVLRDCRTGEALAGQTLALGSNFQGFNTAFFMLPTNPLQQFDYAGAWSSKNFVAETDGSGRFTVNGLPEYANMTINVANPGYDIFTANIATLGGGLTVTMAGDLAAGGPNNDCPACTPGSEDIYVCPVTSSDAIAPYVTGIAPIYSQYICLDCDPNTNTNGDNYRAVIAKNATEFTISLSERVVADASDIMIRNLETNTYLEGYTIVVGADSKSMVVTLPAGLPEGTKLDIIIPRNDVVDTGGNILKDSGDCNNETGYDYYFSTSGACSDRVEGECAGYIKICVITYEAPNLATGEIGAPVQVCDTGIYSGAMATLNTYAPSVFIDCCSNVAGFQQLNGKGGDVNEDDVEIALEWLTETLGLTTNMDTDYAWVAFTPDAANDIDTYAVVVNTSDTGANVLTSCNSNDNVCTPTCTGSFGEEGCASEVTNYTIIFVGDTSKDASFGLSNINVGDSVMIYPVDDFGYFGEASDATVLADCAEPTIIPQTAYGVCNTEGGVAALNQYGSGAELADEGLGGTIASLLYPVTPRMLGRQLDVPYSGSDPLTGNPNPNAAPYLDEPIVIWDLYEGNTFFDADVAGPSWAVDDSIQIQDAFQTYNSYDATAFAAYAPARRVGLNVSEDLMSTVGTVAYDGTADLSLFAVLNNVTSQ